MSPLDVMLLEAHQRDSGEQMRDCIGNLLRSAARGDEWATKLIFERFDKAISKDQAKVAPIGRTYGPTDRLP